MPLASMVYGARLHPRCFEWHVDGEAERVTLLEAMKSPRTVTVLVPGDMAYSKCS